MRLLIDTHCWLWCFLAPKNLGPKAKALITDGDNDVFLSAASAWEIMIKVTTGKLRLPSPPEKYIPAKLAEASMRSLPIEQRHALALARLPEIHRDPFDRILICQSAEEEMPLVTADRKLRQYGGELIWADV